MHSGAAEKPDCVKIGTLTTIIDVESAFGAKTSDGSVAQCG